MKNKIGLFAFSIFLTVVAADNICQCDVAGIKSDITTQLRSEMISQMKIYKTYLSNIEKRLEDTLNPVFPQPDTRTKFTVITSTATEATTQSSVATTPTTTPATTASTTTSATTASTATPTTISSRICATSELSYDNSCIFLPYNTQRVRYSAAERVCTGIGMKLAKITSNEMFDAVATYIADNWGRRTQYTAWFWLGMTFEPVNNPDNLITITPERKITLDKWQDGYPQKGSRRLRYTKMIMQVAVKRFGWQNNGISNSDTLSNYMPLCQYY